MPEYIVRAFNDLNPIYGWIIIGIIVVGVFGQNLLQILQAWRHWRHNDHLLQSCKTRLEIEKLRYEILHFRTENNLPELGPCSAENILAEIDARPSPEDQVTLWDLLTTPPAPRAFEPWNWIAAIYKWHPSLGRLVLMMLGLLCSFLAVPSGAMVIAVTMDAGTVKATLGVKLLLSIIFGSVAFISLMIIFVLRRHWKHFGESH